MDNPSVFLLCCVGLLCPAACWANCEATLTSCSGSRDKVVKSVASNGTCATPGVLAFRVHDTYKVDASFTPEVDAETAVARVWAIVWSLKQAVDLKQPNVCASGLLTCPLKAGIPSNTSFTFHVDPPMTISSPLNVIIMFKLVNTEGESGEEEIFCVKSNIVIEPASSLTFVALV
ncbi:ecdysteroid-regulated 16 kDa protein-like [Pomacea canaliculata]|uniref:ecdysteroid-regulated 16 kDa protein-like n=1 Tax=Pomacea canaliculata TaxID=400727 RepID=UPI000D73BC6F|nr:ecdysteroid-regulated 16 kDa protein-like [Pomacea canaliculata]